VKQNHVAFTHKKQNKSMSRLQILYKVKQNYVAFTHINTKLCRIYT